MNVSPDPPIFIIWGVVQTKLCIRYVPLVACIDLVDPSSIVWVQQEYPRASPLVQTMSRGLNFESFVDPLTGQTLPANHLWFQMQRKHPQRFREDLADINSSFQRRTVES